MLSNKYTIQKYEDVQQDLGDYEATWSDLGVVDGFLDMLTGTDVNDVQNAIIEQSTHVLIVMPIPDFVITDKMRVIFNGNYYSITYVDDPVGQHHHLEIYLTYGGVI